MKKIASKPTQADLKVVAVMKQMREALGKSLRITAKELGVSPSLLSQIETGKKRASPELLDKATDVLQMREALVGYSLEDVRDGLERGGSKVPPPKFEPTSPEVVSLSDLAGVEVTLASEEILPPPAVPGLSMAQAIFGAQCSKPSGLSGPRESSKPERTYLMQRPMRA